MQSRSKIKWISGIGGIIISVLFLASVSQALIRERDYNNFNLPILARPEPVQNLAEPIENIPHEPLPEPAQPQEPTFEDWLAILDDRSLELNKRINAAFDLVYSTIHSSITVEPTKIERLFYSFRNILFEKDAPFKLRKVSSNFVNYAVSHRLIKDEEMVPLTNELLNSLFGEIKSEMALCYAFIIESITKDNQVDADFKVNLGKRIREEILPQIEADNLHDPQVRKILSAIAADPEVSQEDRREIIEGETKTATSDEATLGEQRGAINALKLLLIRIGQNSPNNKNNQVPADVHTNQGSGENKKSEKDFIDKMQLKIYTALRAELKDPQIDPPFASIAYDIFRILAQANQTVRMDLASKPLPALLRHPAYPQNTTVYDIPNLLRIYGILASDPNISEPPALPFLSLGLDASQPGNWDMAQKVMEIIWEARNRIENPPAETKTRVPSAGQPVRTDLSQTHQNGSFRPGETGVVNNIPRENGLKHQVPEPQEQVKPEKEAGTQRVRQIELRQESREKQGMKSDGLSGAEEIQLLRSLFNPDTSGKGKTEIAERLLSKTKLEDISIGKLAKDSEAYKKEMERLVKENMEALLVVDILNQPGQGENKDEVLNLMDRLIKDETQNMLWNEQGIYFSGPREILEHLSVQDLLKSLAVVLDGRFFALILGSSGMVLTSSLGLISFVGFLDGPSFTLAQFLKMFLKMMDEQMPAVKGPKSVLPAGGSLYLYYYWQFIFLCLAFIILHKKMNTEKWRPVIETSGEIQLRRLKILIKVKPQLKREPRVRNQKPVTSNQSTETRRQKIRIPGYQDIRRPQRRYKEILPRREKTRFDAKELRELEIDVNKRLRKMKYWAGYLSSLNQSKRG